MCTFIFQSMSLICKQTSSNWCHPYKETSGEELQLTSVPSSTIVAKLFCNLHYPMPMAVHALLLVPIRQFSNKRQVCVVVVAEPTLTVTMLRSRQEEGIAVLLHYSNLVWTSAKQDPV